MKLWCREIRLCTHRVHGCTNLNKCQLAYCPPHPSNVALFFFFLPCQTLKKYIFVEIHKAALLVPSSGVGPSWLTLPHVQLVFSR